MTDVSIITASDYSRWDDYVHGKSEATPYHMTAWKRAIEAAYGHQGYYLIAEDERGITGVLPLCVLKPPLLKGSLCSLPFCDMGGYLGEDSDPKGILFQKALEITRNYQLKKLEIRQLCVTTDREYSIVENEAQAIKQAIKVQMGMTLPDASETLWSSFKPKLRSQIRKAEKNGINYSQGRSENDVRAFYDVYAANMKKLGSPAHSLRWFQELRHYYGDNMLVGLVSLQSTVVGAGILLFAGNKATIPWASTLAPYNKFAPNMLLYWSFIKNSCDQGFRYFDFGRSTYGEGTFKFKAQWGATPSRLHWQCYMPSGEEITTTNKAKTIRPLLENIWSHAPSAIANTLGPCVRKYISL